MYRHSAERGGYSLIEMVIVVLIFGIVVTVTTTQILRHSTQAQTETTRQQLEVLRNAIEMYHARSGVYPPFKMLETAVAPMLNGPFPSPSAVPADADSIVYYDLNANTASPAKPNPSHPGGWVYKPVNGNLRLNVSETETGHDW